MNPIDVHCDKCGAAPTTPCTTPSKTPTTPHLDRQANADIIDRHLRHMTQTAP